MPAIRASIGDRKCTGLPSSRISPLSGMTAPHSALISVDLPAPLSPITARISFGMQVEIGIVEGHDAAVALVEAARLEGSAVVAHAEIFLIHWSIVTATMISMPTVKSCHSRSRPDEREAVAEHADDQRAEQRADDRAAAAEQARCRRSPRR